MEAARPQPSARPRNQSSQVYPKLDIAGLDWSRVRPAPIDFGAKLGLTSFDEFDGLAMARLRPGLYFGTFLDLFTPDPVTEGLTIGFFPGVTTP
jgi:hypothetical protein